MIIDWLIFKFLVLQNVYKELYMTINMYVDIS